jgi:hypothetical protein
MPRESLASFTLSACPSIVNPAGSNRCFGCVQRLYLDEAKPTGPASRRVSHQLSRKNSPKGVKRSSSSENISAGVNFQRTIVYSISPLSGLNETANNRPAIPVSARGSVFCELFPVVHTRILRRQASAQRLRYQRRSPASSTPEQRPLPARAPAAWPLTVKARPQLLAVEPLNAVWTS